MNACERMTNARKATAPQRHNPETGDYLLNKAERLVREAEAVKPEESPPLFVESEGARHSRLIAKLQKARQP